MMTATVNKIRKKNSMERLMELTSWRMLHQLPYSLVEEYVKIQTRIDAYIFIMKKVYIDGFYEEINQSAFNNLINIIWYYPKERYGFSDIHNAFGECTNLYRDIKNEMAWNIKPRDIKNVKLYLKTSKD